MVCVCVNCDESLKNRARPHPPKNPHTHAHTHTHICSKQTSTHNTTSTQSHTAPTHSHTHPQLTFVPHASADPAPHPFSQRLHGPQQHRMATLTHCLAIPPLHQNHKYYVTKPHLLRHIYLTSRLLRHITPKRLLRHMTSKCNPSLLPYAIHRFYHHLHRARPLCHLASTAQPRYILPLQLPQVFVSGERQRETEKRRERDRQKKREETSEKGSERE